MKIKNNHKIREIAGEKIIVMQGTYGEDMTKVISLNASSEYLLNALANKDFTTDDVAQLLLERYEVSEEIAKKDSQAWVTKLIECGLIEQ